MSSQGEPASCPNGVPQSGDDVEGARRGWSDAVKANRRLLDLLTVLLLRDGGRVEITAEEWERNDPSGYTLDTYQITTRGETSRFLNVEPRVIIWETCESCKVEFRYPHLCREHRLCGLCHPQVER